MILRDRAARALLASTALLGIGMGVYLLALGQLLFRFTGGPAAFALILTLQGIGAICVLPFSGPLVDVLDSRHVYVLCSVLRAVVVCGVAVMALADVPGAVPLIGVGVVLLAVFDNVQRAALFKFTAWHVDAGHRARLNGLLNVAIQAGALSGMALLGVMLLWTSLPVALFVDGLVSLASAALMIAARPTGAEPRRPLTGTVLRAALPGTFRDWNGMFRRYRGEGVVLAMVVLCAADFVFQASLSTLVVPLVNENYGGRGQYVSVFEGVFALGMVASSLFLRYTVRQRLLPLWAALQAAAPLVLTATDAPPLQMAAVFVAGAANLNSVTWLITTLQEHAGAEEKGKMASVRLLSIGVGTVALMPLIGHATAVSLGTGFLTVSAVAVAFTVLSVVVAARYRPRDPSADLPLPGERTSPVPS
ncbi:MFS transporter [Streptomyces sp. RerS4]|uniref:MFS transporter n=1 Tax=Streptomyces sp. RerS4 TaxID=2942449 RepID=UPI00201C2743|nr:MFS transporter [Streptomyces sp. RerS4]UQW99643.1 MFS transporter [Streptomyces sp. RerS4]